MSSPAISEQLREAVEHPPRRCAIERVGGRLRACPEDFAVEEIPAYEADGRPGHLLLWMRKRSLTTEAALRELAKQLAVPRVEIGLAGLKDRDAVTGQRVSVPERAGAKLASFEHPNIELGEAQAHSHKLRRGHLRGNRFTIVVRELEVEPEQALARAQALLEELERRGLYNYYGAQRFGVDARNLQPGLDALAGRRRSKKADMTLSAGQSALFNLYVVMRAQRGGCAQVMAGDILQKRESGGLFECEDPSVDQARLDAGELVVTGPMFGSKMRAPSPQTPAWALEAEVLAEAKITPKQLLGLGRRGVGTRRRLLIWPQAVSAELSPPTASLGPGVALKFELPSGSYATVLLRELT